MNGYSGILLMPAHSFFTDKGVLHVWHLHCELFHREKSSACVYDHHNLSMHFSCHCIIAPTRIQPCLLVRPLENNNPVRDLTSDRSQSSRLSAWEINGLVDNEKSSQQPGAATFVGRKAQGRKGSRTHIALFDVLRDHGNGCGHKTSKRESVEMTDGTVWLQVTLKPSFRRDGIFFALVSTAARVWQCTEVLGESFTCFHPLNFTYKGRLNRKWRV